MPKIKTKEMGSIDIVPENTETIIEKEKEIKYFDEPVLNELAKAVGDSETSLEFIKEEAGDLINHCDKANVLLLSSIFKEVKKLRICLEELSGKLDSNQKSS